MPPPGRTIKNPLKNKNAHRGVVAGVGGVGGESGLPPDACQSVGILVKMPVAGRRSGTDQGRQRGKMHKESPSGMEPGGLECFYCHDMDKWRLFATQSFKYRLISV